MKKLFVILSMFICAQAFGQQYLNAPIPRQHIANAPLSVSVTTSSANMYASNLARTAMSCTNVGAVTAFIAYGSNAAITNGGTAILAGTTWWMDDYLFTTQAIQVIAANPTTLACTEFQ